LAGSAVGGVGSAPGNKPFASSALMLAWLELVAVELTTLLCAALLIATLLTATELLTTAELLALDFFGDELPPPQAVICR